MALGISPGSNSVRVGIAEQNGQPVFLMIRRRQSGQVLLRQVLFADQPAELTCQLTATFAQLSSMTAGGDVPLQPGKMTAEI